MRPGRCVKPNQAKAPRTLQMKMAVEQLAHAGVFEAVKIRQTGYPFRRSHAAFRKEYLWITRRNGGRPPELAAGTSDAAYCKAILGAVPQDFSKVHVCRCMYVCMYVCVYVCMYVCS